MQEPTRVYNGGKSLRVPSSRRFWSLVMKDIKNLMAALFFHIFFECPNLFGLLNFQQPFVFYFPSATLSHSVSTTYCMPVLNGWGQRGLKSKRGPSSFPPPSFHWTKKNLFAALKKTVENTKIPPWARHGLVTSDAVPCRQLYIRSFRQQSFPILQ